MDRSTWSSLSSSDQEIWDQLSNDAKKVILAVGRNANRQVAYTDIEPPPGPDTSLPDPGVTVLSDSSLGVHVASSNPKTDAHPGDPRRVLSQSNPSNTKTSNSSQSTPGGTKPSILKKGSAKAVQINTAQLERMVDAYWSGLDNASDHGTDFPQGD